MDHLLRSTRIFRASITQLYSAGGDKWGRDWLEIEVEEVADSEGEA